MRIGTQPWIGYGPWWIAQDQGMFEKHGLQAELIDFVQDTEVNAAFAAGEMDAANLATHTAIKLFANGVDLRVVLLEDASYEADAIIAGAGIDAIADLAGKTVAYEEGSTSDLLLNYALAENGMSLADINTAPMPASDAGATMIAGQVEVAVTYEPYIAAAIAANPEIKLLYTAGERPGMISDVLAVPAKFLAEQPDAARALMRCGRRHDLLQREPRRGQGHHLCSRRQLRRRNCRPRLTACASSTWPRIRSSLAASSPGPSPMWRMSHFPSA